MYSDLAWPVREPRYFRVTVGDAVSSAPLRGGFHFIRCPAHAAIMTPAGVIVKGFPLAKIYNPHASAAFLAAVLPPAEAAKPPHLSSIKQFRVPCGRKSVVGLLDRSTGQIKHLRFGCGRWWNCSECLDCKRRRAQCRLCEVRDCLVKAPGSWLPVLLTLTVDAKMAPRFGSLANTCISEAWERMRDGIKGDGGKVLFPGLWSMLREFDPWGDGRRPWVRVSECHVDGALHWHVLVLFRTSDSLTKVQQYQLGCKWAKACRPWDGWLPKEHGYGLYGIGLVDWNLGLVRDKQKMTRAHWAEIPKDKPCLARALNYIMKYFAKGTADDRIMAADHGAVQQDNRNRPSRDHADRRCRWPAYRPSALQDSANRVRALERCSLKGCRWFAVSLGPLREWGPPPASADPDKAPLMRAYIGRLTPFGKVRFGPRVEPVEVDYRPGWPDKRPIIFDSPLDKPPNMC